MSAFITHMETELHAIREAGLYKTERVITGPQSGTVRLEGGAKVINLCANNYLGLSDHPELIERGRAALDMYGFGMSSVRFICGTQAPHKELETRLAAFLGFEDTILYAAAFDANGGLFETLLGPEDAIISDALNHASIIDGIRLSKAQRYRYANSDMADLEAKLKEAQGARFRLIATDGVFSMDGYIAKLAEICDLAEKYDARKYSCRFHGVGLCDEWPLIAYSDGYVEGAFDYELEPGMMLCVEALVGEEGGDFCIKLEDQVLITEDGHETFTQYPFDPVLLSA